MVVGTDHDAKKRLKKDSYVKLIRAKNERLDRHSGTRQELETKTAHTILLDSYT